MKSVSFELQVIGNITDLLYIVQRDWHVRIIQFLHTDLISNQFLF